MRQRTSEAGIGVGKSGYIRVARACNRGLEQSRVVAHTRTEAEACSVVGGLHRIAASEVRLDVHQRRLAEPLEAIVVTGPPPLHQERKVGVVRLPRAACIQ